MLGHEILEKHKIPEKVSIIHYTSIDAIVSMLNRRIYSKNSLAKNKENKEKVSLRLYDTVHFNDPDEGRYIYRKLDDSLEKKYQPWFTENEEVPDHADIASFVLPDENDKDKNMADNLVFWRSYGEEGCSLSIPASKDGPNSCLHSARNHSSTASAHLAFLL